MLSPKSNTDSKYVQLNFDELNEKGLEKLRKQIGKSGYNVVKIIPAGKARKKDGIPTKTFTFIGQDSQTMDIQVNDTGDISGIRVNGKNAPYQHAKSFNDLAKTLSELFKKGATAFQKTMARNIARAAKKSVDSNAPKRLGVKSSAQQYTEAKARRDAVSEDLQAASAKLVSTTTKASEWKQKTEKLVSDYTSEQALTRQLKEEIAKLEAGEI
jgi:hypothetical protein